MADTSDVTLSESVSALLLGWILGFGSGAVRAVVAMKGWEWFVTDTFGAPTLGFIETWGLALLVSSVTMHLTGGNKSTRPYRVVVESVLTSLVLSGLFFASLIVLAGFR